MCGRFTLIPEEGALREALGDLEWDIAYEPRYNVAPGQQVAVVLRRQERTRLETMHWGLTPAWAGETDHGNWINARVETVHRRVAFRDAFRLRRAIVPADGFYEWAGAGKRRQPFHVSPAGSALIGFAAVWEDAPGRGLAILTREAVPALRGLHERMPVVFAAREQWQAWLDPAAAEEDLLALSGSTPPLEWRVRPVAATVNSPLNEGPECLTDPDTAAAERPGQLSLFG